VVIPQVYAALRPQVYGQAMESAGEAFKEARVQEEGRTARRADAEGQSGGAFNARSIMAAPPPAAPAVSQAPLTLEQGVTAAAQAAELGELFEYALSTPVSLARQKSAMLPIV